MGQYHVNIFILMVPLINVKVYVIAQNNGLNIRKILMLSTKRTVHIKAIALSLDIESEVYRILLSIDYGLDQFRTFRKHMQVHVQIVSSPKIQILLLNLRLVLWYYLIKASTFKICFCHVK